MFDVYYTWSSKNKKEREEREGRRKLRKEGKVRPRI